MPGAESVPQPESPQPRGPSAGQMLREAREAAGLHVATLAVALKVPVRKLEALEEDRYDQLPDSVFVRALASSVCRTLKIDPQPVLERLPQNATPRLARHEDGINAPFRPAGNAPRPGPVNHVSRPVLLVVAALLIGAIVLIFLPARDDLQQVASRIADPVMPPQTTASATIAPAEPVVPVPGATEAVAAAATAAVVAASAVLAPAASALAAAMPSRAATAASALPAAAVASRPASALVAAAPGSAASAAAAPAAGIVVFRARGPSWIKVADAKGTTVLQKLLGAGESAGATGTLPLNVTVGSAGMTDVQVRGQTFELAPVTRDNVARFEVK